MTQSSKEVYNFGICPKVEYAAPIWHPYCKMQIY